MVDDDRSGKLEGLISLVYYRDGGYSGYKLFLYKKDGETRLRASLIHYKVFRYILEIIR